VPDQTGLRPTPDRVRETLFNWLAPLIRGACVLDCCAGSGVLGLEAASRGSGQVTLVEKERRASQSIQAVVQRLGSESVNIIHADILDYLQTCEQGYDLVFIDPPYALGGLRQSILSILVQRKLLQANALVYLEWPGTEETPRIPAGLEWYRSKSAGQVAYAIAQWRDTR